MAALAVVAVLAVIAPTANAGKDRTIEESFTLDRPADRRLVAHGACGFEVGAYRQRHARRQARARHRPEARRARDVEVRRPHHLDRGGAGKTYTDEIENTSKIEFPEGVDDFGLPAHVTVTGSHGGTFPVGDGPPGHGKFEYEAGFLIGGPDELPFVFATERGDVGRQELRPRDREDLREAELSARRRCGRVRARGSRPHARATRSSAGAASSPRQRRESR